MTERSPGVASDENVHGELERVVSRLLATQQQVIDLRASRDNERRVLDGIVQFGAAVRGAEDARGYWDVVAEAATTTFDCEACIVVAVEGTTLEVRSARGPRPSSPEECAALAEALARSPDGRLDAYDPPAVPPLPRFDGRPLAAVLHAPIEDPATGGGLTLVLAVTERKREFFRPLGVSQLPGLRLFASHIGVIHEMHRSQSRIARQVRLLDHANAALERKLVEERRSTEEREALREALAKARRLEAIGRLAGGIAHDFNNLMAVVNGNAELLKLEADLDEDASLSLESIIQAGARAASLTRQLLTYSRRQVIRLMEADLNALVESTLALHAPNIGPDITLDFTPCPGPTLVKADPDQFGQLLSNLVLNARDAIALAARDPRSARIVVRTERISMMEGLQRPGPAVLLTVSDSGVGMDAETLQRAFEPFFTTKPVGSGTGLGLATVAGVIEQNGGRIEVDSEVGVGTTFRVYWPHLATRGGEAPAPPAASPDRPVVMLVDDEAPIRRLAQRGLERLGFAVQVFDGGPAALAALDGDGPRPDILVTDVRMPVQTGPELACAVHARLPGLPVLYISGFTADLVSRDGVMPPDIELMEKPFSVKDLSARLYRLLAAHRRGASREQRAEQRPG